MHPPSRHHRGIPNELGGTPERLSWPAFVLVEEKPDGVFLIRFTSACEVAGDTWHLTAEDAKHQATAEYEGMLGPWREIPDDVPDSTLPELLEVSESE